MPEIYSDYPLSMGEFAMSVSVPLSEIHRTVLTWLKNRNDSVLFGAQAVNAYVGEPRMTVDIDLMSNVAEHVATEICDLLHETHRIAVRTRVVANGNGFRVYQLQSEGNRHLVDVRQVATLPPSNSISGVLVILPCDLIAQKVISMIARKNTPKSFTDQADIVRLLLAFPELQSYDGPVLQAMHRYDATETVVHAWRDLSAREISPNSDDDY